MSIWITASPGKVLLADRKLPANCQVGDTLDVFVYVDSEGHLAATTKKPLAAGGRYCLAESGIA